MTLWYIMRGTGAAALILLTITLCLGVANVKRWAPGKLQRFLVDDLHRTVSLLSVVLLVVHVVTAVTDKFVAVSILNVLIPFSAGWKPLYIGLGSVSVYLLVALIITSLLRHRIGVKTWKAVHWAAYACWPTAAIHSLGTGTDVANGWMVWLVVGCTAAVAASVFARINLTTNPTPIGATR